MVGILFIYTDLAGDFRLECLWTVPNFKVVSLGISGKKKNPELSDLNALIFCSLCLSSELVGCCVVSSVPYWSFNINASCNYHLVC